MHTPGHRTDDHAALEATLRRDPLLHVYELGDLDEAERAHTTWYADARLDAPLLLYTGLSTPTLIAIAHGNLQALRELLAAVADQLPERFYAHLRAGLDEALRPRFRLRSLGTHLKMGLRSPGAGIDLPSDAVALTNAAELRRFYDDSYPGSTFEPSVLARCPYVGLRDEHGLVAVAGTHVFSPSMRVAALGNIATRPDARGRGLARQVTAALCRALRPTVDAIGLNVVAENTSAIACYRGLGFEVVGEYQEHLVGALQVR